MTSWSESVDLLMDAEPAALVCMISDANRAFDLALAGAGSKEDHEYVIDALCTAMSVWAARRMMGGHDWGGIPEREEIVADVRQWARNNPAALADYDQRHAEFVHRTGGTG